MHLHVLNNYFKGTCSDLERRQVEAWFLTPAGEKYLSDSIEQDIAHLQAGGADTLIVAVDSEKLFAKINNTRKEHIHQHS